MGSVTCGRCGFVSFATSEICKQCGSPLQSAQVSAHNWQPQSAANWQTQPDANWQPQGAAPDWQPQDGAAPNWPPPHQQYAGPSHYPIGDDTPKRKGLSVVSMLCGLFAVPVMIAGAVAAIALGAPAAFLGVGLGLVMVVLALVLGIAATVRANRNPAEFGGRGMAIAGIVLGGLMLVGVVPISMIAAISIPNLMASRRAANEASAIGTLRTLVSAQSTYQSTAGAGEFGSLEDLREQNLIDEMGAAAVKNGYRFEVEASGDTFLATATPVSYPNTGMRSFYVSEDGVIHCADKQGEVADEDDPPLGERPFGGGSMSSGGGEPEIDWTADGPAMQRQATRAYQNR